MSVTLQKSREQWTVTATKQQKLAVLIRYTLQAAQQYGRVISNPITSSYGHEEMSFQVRSHLLNMRISNLLEFFKSVDRFTRLVCGKWQKLAWRTNKHTNIHTRPSTAQVHGNWAMGPCQDDRSRVSYLSTPPQYFWCTTYRLGAIVQNVWNREKSKFIY